MRSIRSIFALPVFASALACAAIVGVAGCSSEVGEDLSEDELKEAQAILGSDRIADQLLDLKKVPGTFQEFEKLYGVGRSCLRQDSKEIFVVEESQTRGSQGTSTTNSLLPRAVVTGCNPDRQNPEAIKNSYSLFAALISDEAQGVDPKNPMVFDFVESIALDRRTGTFNFYRFTGNGVGKAGTIQRFIRDPKTSIVTEYRVEPGKKLVKLANSEGGACFRCHNDGGLIMNEMTDPWTNWVSTRSSLPKEALTGETYSVVSEAAPIGDKKRASFSNDLEKIVEAGLAEWTEGDMATTGFGVMTLKGDMPGGLPHLLQSVFCQTELNYVSVRDVFPLELFVDPRAAAASGIQAPIAGSTDTFPRLLPARSEHDRRVEAFLIKKGILSARTTAAVRLIDDQYDIFSDKRCKVLDQVIKVLPKTQDAAVDMAVKTTLLAALPTFALNKAQSDYLKWLADPASTLDGATARQAYYTDLQTRFTAQTKKLTTTVGRKELQTREATQKANAKKMFPGDANPRPVLD